MNAYRVKEIMWLVIAVMFLVMSLAGCSSAPRKSVLFSDQYCHTSQTITTRDKENVSSETVVKCSDDPVEQYKPAKMGVAKDCHEVVVPMNIGGRLVQERMYACQKLNGRYSVVSSNTLR